MSAIERISLFHFALALRSGSRRHVDARSAGVKQTSAANETIFAGFRACLSTLLADKKVAGGIRTHVGGFAIRCPSFEVLKQRYLRSDPE